MKRTICCLLVFLQLFSFCLTCCNSSIPISLISIALAEKDMVPALSFEKENYFLPNKSSLQIKPILQGVTAKGTIKYSWESSDTTVAGVNNGTVSAKQCGTSSIHCTVALPDGLELSASCDVTVYTPLQSLKLSQQALSIDIGQKTDPLDVSCLPATASYQSVVWSSDNEQVATVDENGCILGISEGTCRIIATSTEPLRGTNKAKYISCRVTVCQPVSHIELEAQTTSVMKGKTLRIAAIISPENASNKKVSWESSDTSVATVVNGTVTAKAGGETTIRCYITNQTGEVVSSELNITVLSSVLSIASQKQLSNLKVNVGDSVEPIALKISPADATCKDVYWTSKDDSIATVDTEGRVTGVKAGRTSITATSLDPYAANVPKSFTFPITVNQGAEAITLSGEHVVAKGKTTKLVVAVAPEDTTNKAVVWSSSDNAVARVNNGIVTGIAKGECIITATASDGSNISASHHITVVQEVTQIRSNHSQRIAITEGNSRTLSVTVVPADATNQKLLWSSTAENIATVDENGKVTAKRAGSCSIKAAATDGSNRSVTIPIVVEPKIPLDATKFTRSGYFGMYYEFAVTFKNLCKTRGIKYVSFDLKYSYAGSTNTFSGHFTDRIGTNSSRQVGWWDQIGYRLSYSSNFRIYLRSVQYTDGSWSYFGSDEALIGWFN